MIVFNSYFKIIKVYIPMIILYTAIFMLFAILSSTTGASSATDFSTTKPKVAIVNNDQDTDLIKSFKSYLKENAAISKIDNSENSLRDALFFRSVDYILIIPKNFTSGFMTGKEPLIETMKVPDSYDATYTEMLLNKYLNIARLYAKSGMSEKELSDKVLLDLDKTVNVKLDNKNDVGSLQKANYFYNFSNYTFLALIILIVGMTMGSFREQKIKRRNMSSPISLKKINWQLALGNLTVAIGMWLLYVLISMIMYNKVMFTLNGLLLIINLLAFTICALSLGFLIGNLVINKQANSSIANVVSLGSSFLCGAFVPQMLLGESVLSFSKILPSYWFIKNNDTISSISSFSSNNLMPIFINIGIVLLFALLFYMVMQIVTRWQVRHS